MEWDEKVFRFNSWFPQNKCVCESTIQDYDEKQELAHRPAIALPTVYPLSSETMKTDVSSLESYEKSLSNQEPSMTLKMSPTGFNHDRAFAFFCIHLHSFAFIRIHLHRTAFPFQNTGFGLRINTVPSNGMGCL